MTDLTPFHLAIPVDDLQKADAFYGQLLGCAQGRSSDCWTDYDFFGHQLVCHLSDPTKNRVDHNPVDGQHVPVPHFGVVLHMSQWHDLKDRLVNAKVNFVIEPYVRFKGLAGEQATMFLYDPCGNALEFKAFKDIDTELFKK